MDKMLRSDNLCNDILGMVNYLKILYSSTYITEDLKNQIGEIIKSATRYYNMYQCFPFICKEKAIKDFSKIKERINRLYIIRKINNKSLITQYDDLCFYMLETKNLYYSDFVI